MRNWITLLEGATLSVVQEGPRKFTATVSLGPFNRKEATAADPVKALGLAVMLQAGFTEDTLKAALLEIEQ